MHRLLILPFLMITVLPAVISAQGVALEFGTAAVERIGVQQNAGISVRIPFTERIIGSFTYSRWRGQDKDLESDFNNPDTSFDTKYYGNAALNLLFFGEVISFGRPALFIGAGMGLYQFIELDRMNNQNSIYRSYFSAASSLRFPISDKSVFFLKAIGGFRGNGVTPRWGIFTAGIEIIIY